MQIEQLFPIVNNEDNYLIWFKVESLINKIYGKPTQTSHIQFANMQSFNVVFKKVFRKAIHDGSLRLYIINIINTVRQNKTQLVTYAAPESFPRQILILHPMMPR